MFQGVGEIGGVTDGLWGVVVGGVVGLVLRRSLRRQAAASKFSKSKQSQDKKA